jgi:adenosylcobyric acid synthase
VVPGSKQTLRDLEALQQSAAFCGELQRFAASGGHVFGVCGGMQLLGRELHDPEGLEGGSGASSRAAGLNLLPLRTVFGGEKALRQRASQALWPAFNNHTSESDSLQIEGFELHRGSTTALEPCQSLCADEGLGWVEASVAGTYLHGVFESGPWRRRWLNQLRARKGLPMLSEQQPHHSRQRDALLDRLADAFEQHVNLEPLLIQP